MNQHLILAKFLVKMHEMTTSKGFLIDSKSHNLNIAYKIFVKNYVDLARQIQKVPIFGHEQFNEKLEFQIDSLRFLVNFLNSACALKEQMRKYMKSLYGGEENEFLKKYTKEVHERFIKNPEAGFLEFLRNFYDHNDILPVVIHSQIQDGEFYSQIMLDKSSLVENGESLNEKAKKYLESAPENIDILKICSTYVDKSLFPWIMREQNDLHKEEFAALRAMKIELKDIMDSSKRKVQ